MRLPLQMRKPLAVVAFLSITQTATAQTPPLSAVPNSGNPYAMPGVPVGKPLLQPVGTQLPAAGQPVGNRVGKAPGDMPFIPDTINQMPGQVDLSNVIAPLPETMMAPPDPSLWDKFVAKFGASIGFVAPEPPSPTWIPGISRRNRERARERWMMWWRN